MKFFKSKKFFLILLLFVVIVQLFRIDKTNPPVEPDKDFIVLKNPPTEIKNILKSSCYDCHSNTTIYPWYTNISPISWWIKYHINEGRKELNFSIWGDYSEKRAKHKLEECFELIEKKEMPLNSYTWIHDEAKLSNDQIETLIVWFKAQSQL